MSYSPYFCSGDPPDKIPYLGPRVRSAQVRTEQFINATPAEDLEFQRVQLDYKREYDQIREALVDRVFVRFAEYVGDPETVETRTVPRYQTENLMVPASSWDGVKRSLQNTVERLESWCWSKTVSVRDDYFHADKGSRRIFRPLKWLAFLLCYVNFKFKENSYKIVIKEDYEKIPVLLKVAKNCPHVAGNQGDCIQFLAAPTHAASDVEILRAFVKASELFQKNIDSNPSFAHNAPVERNMVALRKAAEKILRDYGRL